jgi:hypothetical protein
LVHDGFDVCHTILLSGRSGFSFATSFLGCGIVARRGTGEFEADSRPTDKEPLMFGFYRAVKNDLRGKFFRPPLPRRRIWP